MSVCFIAAVAAVSFAAVSARTTQRPVGRTVGCLYGERPGFVILLFCIGSCIRVVSPPASVLCALLCVAPRLPRRGFFPVHVWLSSVRLCGWLVWDARRGLVLFVVLARDF